MSAPKIILELIDRFDRNLEAYKSGKYNETQLRREFIDPFFEALGWDVHNKQGYAEAYKDVIHEDSIKVGVGTKAPDYCFRIGGQRKFFVEAKKPSVDVKKEISPAYQVRRYAWSAKLPLSILTDFEEFSVYDCRTRPLKNDKASTARILYLTYKDFIDRWDEIASIFSREAIPTGLFEKYVKSAKKKRGTAEVDNAFLKEIESWRVTLAKSIAEKNKKLTRRELNFAVQRTIDRIIFLRICEDRGIENYGQLMALQNGSQVYTRLCDLFKKADDKYNSGLFHFNEERGRVGEPDNLSLNLKIDDDVLRKIVKHLYYPDSPYEFSVLPADILGQVYEQFLGKVISLTSSHKAKIEEKPEVRKAGGVYYTPTYIVDYIVKNTVSKLVEGKTPKQAAKLKILDPACGSGSFLIGAFQYLIDWHRDWYEKDGVKKWTTKKRPVLFQDSTGEWKLTTSAKRQILLNNIHGVDIDSQAVEVTKLSLLLKVLEGETEQTLNSTLSLFNERALPDLGNNIKCGNSLIGPDFYDNEQMSMLNEEERYRINVFDWKAEFPDIMKSGGFDAVIGNPPYIRIQAMKEWALLDVDYYKKAYEAASRGNYDIYVVFVEKSLNLLNLKGRLGFILPHKFFNAKYGEPLREILSAGKCLSKIVHFGHQQVFAGSTTYTCLLFLDKKGAGKFEFEKVDDLEEWRINGKATEGMIDAKNVNISEWNFVVGESVGLFDKLNKISPRLGDIADIFVGIQTSADSIFIMDLIKEAKNVLHLRSKSLGRECVFEKDLFFPLVSGTDVNRYKPLPKRQYLLFPYDVSSEKVKTVDWRRISLQYPKTAKYLLANKNDLENRERGKGKGPNWYGYIYLKNMNRQTIEKLCIPRLVEQLYATYDVDGSHFLDNVDVCGIKIKTSYKSQLMTYLLGLLNSKLLRWYFPFVSAPFRGGWLSANKQFISQLPIRLIDFSNSEDKADHEQIVKSVDKMLELHRQLSETRMPHEKEIIKRQIGVMDKQIDELVYELYGLTEEEIGVVESK